MADIRRLVIEPTAECIDGIQSCPGYEKSSAVEQCVHKCTPSLQSHRAVNGKLVFNSRQSEPTSRWASGDPEHADSGSQVRLYRLG